jgi:hypothetical protein
VPCAAFEIARTPTALKISEANLKALWNDRSRRALRAVRLVAPCLLLFGFSSSMTPSLAGCYIGGDDLDDTAEWYIYQSGGLATSCENLTWSNSTPSYVAPGLSYDEWSVLGSVVNEEPENYRLFAAMSMETYGEAYTIANAVQVESLTGASVSNFGAFAVHTYDYIKGYRFVMLYGGCPAAQFPPESTSIWSCAAWAMAQQDWSNYLHAEPTLCFADPVYTNFCSDRHSADPVPW